MTKEELQAMTIDEVIKKYHIEDCYYDDSRHFLIMTLRLCEQSTQEQTHI